MARARALRDRARSLPPIVEDPMPPRPELPPSKPPKKGKRKIEVPNGAQHGLVTDGRGVTWVVGPPPPKRVLDERARHFRDRAQQAAEEMIQVLVTIAREGTKDRDRIAAAKAVLELAVAPPASVDVRKLRDELAGMSDAEIERELREVEARIITITDAEVDDTQKGRG